MLGRRRARPRSATCGGLLERGGHFLLRPRRGRRARRPGSRARRCSRRAAKRALPAQRHGLRARRGAARRRAAARLSRHRSGVRSGLEGARPRRRVRGHDDFVTVGRNVGQRRLRRADLRAPLADDPAPRRARPLPRCRQVATTSRASAAGAARTTGSSTTGRSLGLRVHEFRKFVELPSRVDAPFRVALEIDASDANDLESLRENGWLLVDPREVASDPARYLRFVQGSLAEFTVAKGIYVSSQSGWLGDRTACYLASGKPALVQDTGLAAHYPLGEGLAHVLDAGRGGGRSGADPRRLPDARESGPPACRGRLRRAARPAASARGARVVTRGRGRRRAREQGRQTAARPGCG